MDVLTFISLFGVFPFKFKNLIFEKSKILFINLIYLILILIAIISKYILSIDSESVNKSIINVKNLEFGFAIINLVNASVNIISCGKLQKNTKKILNLLIEQQNYLKIKFKIPIYIKIITFTIFLIVLFFLICDGLNFNNNNQNYYLLIIYLIYNWCILIPILSEIIFYIICFQLKCTFKELNNIIIQLKICNSNKIIHGYYGLVWIKLENLRELHTTLCDLVEEVNSRYQIEILTGILSSQILLICNLFLVIVNSNSKRILGREMYTMVSVLCLLRLFLICFHCVRVKDEVCIFYIYLFCSYY
jgi:hypothetical protein